MRIIHRACFIILIGAGAPAALATNAGPLAETVRFGVVGANPPDEQRLLGELSSIEPAIPRFAELRWDVNRQQLYDAADRVVAYPHDVSEAQDAINRWLAGGRLAVELPAATLKIAGAEENEVLSSGETLALRMPVPHQQLLMFHLAPTGELRFLFALQEEHMRQRDEQGRVHLPRLRITPPYGAEQLIAVSMSEIDWPSLKGLFDRQRQTSPQRLVNWLREQRAQGVELSLGERGFYTAPSN